MNFRQSTEFNQLTSDIFQVCNFLKKMAHKNTLKRKGTQITVESVSISRFTINNIAPKLQKCWTHKIAFKIISKMLKQLNFFYSQPSTLPKEALAKFYLSTTFGLSFIIHSVTPTRSSTFYTYSITKIGNRNRKGVNWRGNRCPYFQKETIQH